jgi:hypothetical protein
MGGALTKEAEPVRGYHRAAVSVGHDKLNEKGSLTVRDGRVSMLACES